MECVTIPEKLFELLDNSPEKPLITAIDDATLRPTVLTVKRLVERAKAIAHHLRSESKLSPGDKVVLNYPQGLEFVEAFFGCQFAGLVPVPVSPPVPSKTEKGYPNYANITKNSEARAQLTCTRYTQSKLFPQMQLQLHEIHGIDLPWITTDTVPGEEMSPLPVKPDDIAFLQYTSGSTRAPRGAQVTYENVYVQVELLKELLSFDETSVTLFWMPHYHDFSLINGILSAIYGHAHLVLFSPQLFLKNPAVWFELAQTYGATHVTSPNFGYSYVIDRTTPEQRAKWSLGAVKKIICAAEPIRPRTIDRFYEAMKETGLLPETFCAAYGLAEHTLAVSVNGQRRIKVRKEILSGHEGDEGEVELMSCGPIHPSVDVKIVDPESFTVLTDSQIGEIWVSSKNVVRGYFNNPAETTYKFGNTLPHSEKNWLRTGDLGFTQNGELVCTGRIDDMIIIRGQNLYPQDIEEAIVESNPIVKAGRVLVFGTEKNGQTLVHAVIEMNDEDSLEHAMKTISLQAREALFRQMGLSNAVLLFAPKGTIPKTTSGKLQRKKCKQIWEDGKLTVLKVDGGLL